MTWLRNAGGEKSDLEHILADLGGVGSRSIENSSFYLSNLNSGYYFSAFILLLNFCFFFLFKKFNVYFEIKYFS